MMPRRKPVGCTFWPTLTLPLIHGDGDVAEAPLVAVDATTSRRPGAREAARIACDSALHVQAVRVEREIVLRVAGRGLHDLRHKPGVWRRQELQQVQRLLYRPARQMFQDQPH